MLFERGAGRAQAREDQAAIDADAWNLRQRELFFPKRRIVTARIRDAHQIAAIIIRPAVIGAAEGMRVAAFALANGVAAMPTAIQQQMNLPVRAARDDHRLQSDRARHVIAGLGNFARVRDVDPLAMPNLRDFVVKDCAIAIELPADAIIMDQVRIIHMAVGHRCHLSRLLAGYSQTNRFSPKAGPEVEPDRRPASRAHRQGARSHRVVRIGLNPGTGDRLWPQTVHGDGLSATSS